MAYYSGNKIQDPIKNNSELSKTKNPTENVDELDVKRKKRDYNEENWFFWVRMLFLLGASFVSFLIIFILFWNILMPVDWRWLCDDDLKTVKDIAVTIIVGLIMSFSTTYLFRRK